ncbi:hypothetical protein NDU88_005808 [Pleurodeles waltl]|uniref:Uncharacterized protein n=1 Tax=Pleurodeles waltl TaxID=8319 RepID=A0AAV7PJ71_PLEWA|nr:hypothetical protein NDU88_005808 [Pleurodeles waltl]
MMGQECRNPCMGKVAGDPEGQRKCILKHAEVPDAIVPTGVLNGYFSANWATATTRGIEWEALKVAITGESLSKTYGIRKRLDQELTQQEDVWQPYSAK